VNFIQYLSTAYFRGNIPRGIEDKPLKRAIMGVTNAKHHPNALKCAG
jgi:hypothetical protein